MATRNKELKALEIALREQATLRRIIAHEWGHYIIMDLLGYGDYNDGIDIDYFNLEMRRGNNRMLPIRTVYYSNNGKRLTREEVSNFISQGGKSSDLITKNEMFSPSNFEMMVILYAGAVSESLYVGKRIPASFSDLERVYQLSMTQRERTKARKKAYELLIPFTGVISELVDVTLEKEDFGEERWTFYVRIFRDEAREYFNEVRKNYFL